MYTNTSDAQLLDYWRARRDADAFAELVARYGPLVYSACLRVLRSTHAAEDAAQECFIDLIRTQTDMRSLPAFLHTTATRRALDRLRSEKRRADREARFATEQPREREADWEEISRFVDEAIARLPEKQRQPIVLRFFQGRTYAEIAAETGVAPSTVQHHLNKGVEGIRRHLKRHGITASAGTLASVLAAAPSEALPPAVAVNLGTMALAGGNAAAAATVVTASGWTTSAFLGKTAIAAATALVFGLLTAVSLVLVGPESAPNPAPVAVATKSSPPTAEVPPEPGARTNDATITPAETVEALPTDRVIEGIVVTRGGRPTAGAVVNAT